MREQIEKWMEVCSSPANGFDFIQPHGLHFVNLVTFPPYVADNMLFWKRGAIMFSPIRSNCVWIDAYDLAAMHSLSQCLVNEMSKLKPDITYYLLIFLNDFIPGFERCNKFKQYGLEFLL